MADISILQAINGGIDTTINATNRTSTFGANITSGSYLLAVCAIRNADPAGLSISDDKSNTWTSLGTVFEGVGSRGIAAWYCLANAGSIGFAPVVTFNKGGNSCGIGRSIYELANVHSDFLDGAVVTGSSGTNTSPASVTLGSTSYTNDLIFGICAAAEAAYTTLTPLTNYTASVSNTNTTVSLQHKTLTRATTAAAAYTPGFTLSVADKWAFMGFAIKGNTTAPTISGGTANPVHLSTGNTVTGVNFGSNTGSAALTIGGQAQTVTGWTSTTITYTANRGVNLDDVAVNAVVTDSTGITSNSYALTGFDPPAGYSYVTLTSVNATAAYRITAGGDLAIGNQLEWDNSLVTINDDGSFVADPSVSSFYVRVGVTTDGWGALALQTINGSSSVSGFSGVPVRRAFNKRSGLGF